MRLLKTSPLNSSIYLCNRSRSSAHVHACTLYCRVLPTWWYTDTSRPGPEGSTTLTTRRVLSLAESHVCCSLFTHPPIDLYRFVAAYVKHSFDIFSRAGGTNVSFRISEIQAGNACNSPGTTNVRTPRRTVRGVIWIKEVRN